MKATLEKLHREYEKTSQEYEKIRERQREIVSDVEFWYLDQQTQMEYDNLWSKAGEISRRGTRIKEAIKGIENAMQIIKELETDKQ